MNKTALFNLSYGVYVVTTWAKGKATGCTANSAMQITSSPATIAVSINHDNYTNECIKDTGVFAINMLILTVPTLIKQKLSRWQGVSLLGIYAAFCVLQFVL